MVRTRPRSPKLFFRCALLFLGLWNPCALSAQSPPKPSAHKRSVKRHASDKQKSYAYFFNLTGDFEKIELGTKKEVDHGQVPVAAKIVRPFQTSGFDGCIFCSVRYDKRYGRFYVVMAKHVDDSGNGGDNFEVVSVAPPRMYTAMRADVSATTPNILVSPDGSRVLASYQINFRDTPDGQLAFGLSIFNAPALKLLRADKESTTTEAFANGYVFKLLLSGQAYFGEDGSIYDQFSRAMLVNDQLQKTTIDPVALLVRSGGKALAPFALVDVNTKASTFEVSYVDSTAGKTLAALNASGKGPQALIVIDLKSKGLSAPIKVSNLAIPATHLIADGTQILVEESELRHREDAKPDEPQDALFKTGKLTIFNVVGSNKPREVSSPKPSGSDSRLICTSADGKTALFTHDAHLFAIDLIKGTTLDVGTQPQFAFDQWTKCVMADR